jgi:hypothetical protein
VGGGYGGGGHTTLCIKSVQSSQAAPFGSTQDNGKSKLMKW